MAALRLRDDYDATILRALARRAMPVEARNRMLGIAAAYDGATRTAAAEVAGIGRQILRDWIIRFNAEGPEGLYDLGFRGGESEKLDEEQRAVLHVIIQRAEGAWLGCASTVLRRDDSGVRREDRSVADLT